MEEYQEDDMTNRTKILRRNIVTGNFSISKIGYCGFKDYPPFCLKDQFSENNSTPQFNTVASDRYSLLMILLIQNVDHKTFAWA